MSEAPERTGVSVVIVSWNVRGLLLRCLEALRPCGFEVIVADNASSDGTPGAVKAGFPGVTLLESRENLGFARACNLGAGRAAGEFLVFLNPDTEPRAGSLEKLVSFLAATPAAAAAGAKLLWPDGSYQESYRRHPGAFFSVLEILEFHYYFPGNPLRLASVYGGRPFSAPARVDWLVGAAFAVRRKTFEACGGFDERYFMYSEDADLCRRLGAAGGEVWFVPEAGVVHHKGRSSAQSGVRGADYYKSLCLYHRLHTGLAAALACRAALACACLLHLAVSCAKLPACADKSACLSKISARYELLKWSVGA